MEYYKKSNCYNYSCSSNCNNNVFNMVVFIATKYKYLTKAWVTDRDYGLFNMEIILNILPCFILHELIKRVIEYFNRIM